MNSFWWLYALMLIGFVFTGFVFVFLAMIIGRSVCDQRGRRG